MYGWGIHAVQIPENFWILVSPFNLSILIIGLTISLSPHVAYVVNYFYISTGARKSIFRLLSAAILFLFSLGSIFANGSGTFLYFRF
jgi:hypothetical protein